MVASKEPLSGRFNRTSARLPSHSTGKNCAISPPALAVGDQTPPSMLQASFPCPPHSPARPQGPTRQGSLGTPLCGWRAPTPTPRGTWQTGSRRHPAAVPLVEALERLEADFAGRFERVEKVLQDLEAAEFKLMRS